MATPTATQAQAQAQAQAQTQATDPVSEAIRLSAYDGEKIGSRHELQQAITEINRGAQLFGYLLTWEARGIVIPIDACADMLQRHGLGHLAMPNIRTKNAVKRALDEMANDKLVRKVAANESTLVRNVANTNSKVVYALVVEHADAMDETLNYDTEMQVRFDKTAAAGVDPLSFDAPSSDAYLRPLIMRYLTSFTSRDVTKHVLAAAVAHARGLCVRGNGGLYFVPPSATQAVEALQGFMGELATSGHVKNPEQVYLSVLPQSKTKVTQTSLTKPVRAALESLMKDVARDLREMAERDRKQAIDPDTVAAKLRYANEVGLQVATYVDMLAERADSMKTQLRQMKLAFVALRDGMAPGDVLSIGRGQQGYHPKGQPLTDEQVDALGTEPAPAATGGEES